MAKRFTDTEKWKDEWFLELEPLMKILWLYMLDTCDHAGVWKVNFKLASYSIGTALDRQSALNALGDRIHVISLDKWHIPKFITYQQKGFLNPSNKSHKGILNLLDYHKIDSSPFLAPSKPLRSEVTLDQRGTGIGIGIGIGNNTSSLNNSNKEELVSINPPEKNLPEKQSLNFRNPKDSVTPDNVIQLFNDKCASKGRISFCRGLSSKNIEDFKVTISYQDFKKLKTWAELFTKTANSLFLTGQQSGRGFVATLDWLVIHDNALKVLNGKYDKGETENVTSSKFGGKNESSITPEEIQRAKELGII